MTGPSTRTEPAEDTPAAPEPLTARHLLLGVALFAGIWLVNGLVALVVISLLQGTGLWEAAAEGGSAVDDLMGGAMSRLGLSFGEART